MEAADPRYLIRLIGRDGQSAPVPIDLNRMEGQAALVSFQLNRMEGQAALQSSKLQPRTVLDWLSLKGARGFQSPKR